MEAYFDESGTHPGSPMMCVAGYLFDPRQAQLLDKEWELALSQYGLKYFHMADCAHGTRDFRKLSAPERDDVARRMIGIVKRRATMGVAVSMSDADFERLKPPQWQRGGAYTIACIWCIRAIALWADRNAYDGHIQYFFESGHKHQRVTNLALDFIKQFPHIVNAARYHSHAFATKKDVRPLQAADLLAWEHHKEYMNQHCSPRRPRRLSYMNLLEAVHIEAHFGPKHLESFFRYGLERFTSGSLHDLSPGSE